MKINRILNAILINENLDPTETEAYIMLQNLQPYLKSLRSKYKNNAYTTFYFNKMEILLYSLKNYNYQNIII